MTEHAQLELIAAVVLITMNIVNTWRAELANRYAKEANIHAMGTRAKQAEDIKEVHQLVNGGLVAAKQEIEDLKTEARRLNIVISEMIRAKAEADMLKAAVPVVPVVAPEQRLNEIRGQE